MKILFLAPHLSTGGMPQFLLKRIELLKKYTDAEIHVVEYAFHGDAYVVQRNAIRELVSNKFAYDFDKKIGIADYIKITQPDIVHIDEMSERLDIHMVKDIYDPNRKYRIVETCHDISFNPESKIFHPDLYIFCTPYHEDTFADLISKYITIQYPIENKEPTADKYIQARKKLGIDDIHKTQVLNVGLWTPGKNQAEALEIAKKYPNMTFHFVGNMAVNFKEYWEPLVKEVPKNVVIWGERNDVATFLEAADMFMFNSTWECNPLALREAISYGLPIVARDLPQYKGMYSDYIHPIDTNLNDVGTRDYEIPITSTKEFALDHIKAYKRILDAPVQKQDIQIRQHFVDTPFLEIKGVSDSDFLVKFLDEKGKCQYKNTIKSNSWVKLNRKYYTKWTTKVYENGKLIYDKTLNLKDKRVYIALDSKSLGDTIAWAPYALEFQKKHDCKVIMSTFWNNILDYPELEMVKPGTKVDCYAMYKLGWHWDESKEPVLCNTIPLQQAASNILGLDFKPIKPKLKHTHEILLDKPKYVTIATNSTMECKFWTREGWQNVINYLNELGYEVINVSKEDNPFDNCSKITNTDIRNTMDVISGSELFIGLSSGLSWLSWALNKKVVMISNFTEQDHEFDCYRVIKPDVCNGCWNDPNIRLDPFWNWCPRNKNFECQRSITPQMVIDKIKEAGF